VSIDCCLDAFDSSSAGGRPNRTRLSNILMQLRKCVAHPYLFDGMHREHIESTANLFTLDLLSFCIDSLFGREQKVIFAFFNEK